MGLSVSVPLDVLQAKDGSLLLHTCCWRATVCTDVRRRAFGRIGAKPWGALGSSEAALTVIAALPPFSTGAPSKLPGI